ncbi:MAG TPA: aminoacyl-tRNA hydrolase [Polyangiaceae bacterium]|nr:aminoacyl-tRNA hydrolase [Polyangiaceae bacterium]
MILIVGLGNPGPRYADTRHNAGFQVVDRLVERAGGASFREKFHGHFAQVTVDGAQLSLLKPMTFMNESGRSVQAAVQHFKLPLDSLLVVHDELDLPFAEVRLKQGGGDAGQRGVRSISGALGPNYPRLRVGIGRPPPEFKGDVADFVLQACSLADRDEMRAAIDRAADAVVLVATRGISAAMNATNQRKTR